jgi:hypothetical protein
VSIFLLILSAAIVLAVLHMVAPDHWIPLTVVSKKFNYSSSKTYETALLIGILHSAASVTLAVVAYFIGELLVKNSLHFLYLSSVILLIIVGIYFIVNGYFEDFEDPESSTISTKSILTVSIFPDFAFIPIMLAASTLPLIQVSAVIMAFILLTCITVVIMTVGASKGFSRTMEKVPPRYIDYIIGAILFLTATIIILTI